MCTHTYLLLLYFTNFFQQIFAQSNINTYLCSQIILVLTPIKELLISKLQIMKKNYFKFLMAIAMMLGGVSLTSCDEMLDNPVEEPTEQTEEPKIVETETGAEITINALSDISGLLGELTPMIEAKNGEEFVLDVKSNGSLKVTETDNIILVPNVAGCNLVINFDNSLVSDGTAVTMKLDSKAGTRDYLADENGNAFDKNVALNLKNANTDLILDVPGVTVTVSSLSSIQVVNGKAIVKDGASIDTYVYAPKSNDITIFNGYSETVKLYFIDEETGEETGGWRNEPAVGQKAEWGGIENYHFKNIKVVKGKADYAKISLDNSDYKLDKLTIAEGATVLLNQTPQVKEIVGEGNQTAKIQFDSFWRWYEDEDGNKYARNNGYLTFVEKISNIIVDDEYTNDYYNSTKNSYLTDVPADAENVIFKFSEINFRNPEAATASVKNCKFESSNKNYRRAQINVPYQSTEISSFKFTFDNCEFSDEFKISASVNERKYIFDENGNPVWVYYYEYREEGKWISFEVASFDEIPEEAKEKDGFDYWMGQKYETVTYKDYYATIAFIDCKYADKALTPETNCFDYRGTPSGAYIRYEFDGKTYRAIQTYDPEKEGEKSTWVLIEVND